MSINLDSIRRLTTKKTATASAACAGALAVTFAVVPGGSDDSSSSPSFRTAAEDVETPSERIAVPGSPEGIRGDFDTHRDGGADENGDADDTPTAPVEARADAADSSPARQRAAELSATHEQTSLGDTAEQATTQISTPAETEQASTPETSYTDDLDGWIREALDIMEEEGIPGSYEGLHRNIIRESSGDPWAINEWDINAQNGVPSKGLLQVIQPTFDAYHVEGTEFDLYDPVANLTAAANYAADRYGSIDNVDGPY